MDKPEITPLKLPNEKRRILVRGGLAAPIVLGTLASKQALATGAHYGCSVSGKWSGGSTHGAAPNCKTGKSCKDVQTACAPGWSNKIKGNCQKRTYDKVHWDGNNHTQMQYCYQTVHDVIGYGGTSLCRKKDTNGYWQMHNNTGGITDKNVCKRMTAYEALFLDTNCTSDTSLKKHAALAREAVCAVYNANTMSTSGYPLSETQVRGMANDCLNYGQVYLSKYFSISNDLEYWTTDEVIAYFKEIRMSDGVYDNC